MERLKVAAVQMVSSTCVDENLARAQQLVAEAAAAGAQLVVLPEYFCLMGRSDTDKLVIAEAHGDGLLQRALAALAREHRVWLVAGTLPLVSPEAGKVYNSTLVYTPGGREACRYDKVHLFGFSGLGERYAEADTILPGTAPASFEMPGARVALGVCYDLRFAELFRRMAPFDVLVLPAAFTAVTGEAHWEVLLRARAIENQCYVVASAQEGLHENGRRTHGHSMIIDPWGRIEACLPEGEGVVVAELDPARLASVRSRLPALAHRVF
ncbi:carbon-nitrogen hydrolase family protein [Crenobacter caeni]|uniref:Carbon-nitrogen hydrolase family protein n=1 Tax=Crenobacter caeni TaxID=2705474 RepID=A0A6B2KQN3_9NEIS|nr:carbon-nitrogen hydrolase family protein [Crenobacter caeni]NDV12361.1 carbon-nitrogen hydrolase family protein [Crenobacter caeni]